VNTAAEDRLKVTPIQFSLYEIIFENHYNQQILKEGNDITIKKEGAAICYTLLHNKN
jgi:hypothetical protein